MRRAAFLIAVSLLLIAQMSPVQAQDERREELGLPVQKVEPPAKTAETPYQPTPIPQDKRFDLADRNHDGVITFSEFAAAYPRLYPSDNRVELMSQRFAVMDTDNNGVISRKEFTANDQAPIDENYTMRWTPNGARDSN